MATIGQLLDRLAIQIHDLTWTSQDTVGAHAAGWMPLAKATGQAITLLPLGGRSDQVKAGIRNVLAPLAHGPRKLDGDAAPAPQLLELATTVGAISDSLAGILRWGPRPEQVGTPALQLEAELLSAVHVAARWSRAALERQINSGRRPPIATFLADLLVVTEPYSLIAPHGRTSSLEDLGFIGTSSRGLDGEVAAWAETAGSILGGRYRVSGWAMQIVAADLALIALALRRPFILADVGAPVGAAAWTDVAEALKLAARSWRLAAAWPPHVRLGGQNADLRMASREVREILTTSQVISVAEARRVLSLVVPIGAAQARCMNSLMNRQELWVHAKLLVPKIQYQEGWIREPSWSAEGWPLRLAAEAGQLQLDRALSAIGAVSDGGSRRQRPRYAPDTLQGVLRLDSDPVGHSEHRDVRGSPAL